jgi:CBS domain containing-hemolysin-like protein
LDVKTKLVKDLMVPLSEYATVSRNATLSEAVTALKQAQADYDQSKYRHRAILIYGDDKKIVGKVNLRSVLRGLEPKYENMLSDKAPSHVGFTRGFQRSIIDQFRLWQDPLDKICEKAAGVKVESFMTALSPEEIIAADATLAEAIHYFVTGHHQSLLVTENDAVVGILRLTDIYEVVAEAVTSCAI